MASSSRIRELAKKLVQLSLAQEGRVEDAKEIEVLEALGSLITSCGVPLAIILPASVER